MEQFIKQITDINSAVNDFIWVKIGLVLLLGAGILMTCCTKWFQVSHLRLWWKSTIGNIFSKSVIGHTDEKGAISPFQALCTALAATIGTGNIAGVAAAIVFGGPGAIFWMWIAAFFGMMTNYSENVLGLYFRRKNKANEWSGGAMYYLRDGLGAKKGCKGIGSVLAVLFSCFAILASFGIGNMSQTNKIVSNITSAFDIPALSSVKIPGGSSLYALIIGIVLMLLAGSIIIGGLKRIASFAEKVVPFMVILYVVGGIIIIAVNYAQILPAFKAIFVTAFKPIAVEGGILGYLISKVITQGFKRGCFSNEAGLGSSVMVHSNSNVKEPVLQGMWGIFEVFADTIVVCTMTALIVLTSGVFDLSTGKIIAEGVDDGTLVAAAFNAVFPWGNIGQKFVAIALFLFAFTTVLGWSHYGTKAIEYLFGEKAVPVYNVVFVLMISIGGLMSSSLAWDISDTFNGLMMIPNLIGVATLCPLVTKITRNYVDRHVRCKVVKPLLSYDETIQAEAEDAINKGAQ